MVSAGDDLYGLLALAQRGGLLASAPRSGATRYEMALETGRAALALASRRSAQARVSEDSVRALSELLTRLRPELRRLDVDVDAALALCRAASTGAQSQTGLLSAASGLSNGGSRGAGLVGSRLTETRRSLSGRLRREAAQNFYNRSASDPFGGEAGRSPSFFGAPSSNRGGAAFFDRPKAGPHGVYGGAQSIAASTSVDIFSGVRVRTGLGVGPPSMQPGGLRALGAASPEAALLPSAGGSRSVGVGADIDLPAGVTLSGDVRRLGSLFSGSGGFEGTIYGGQARLSAFNDRLSLSLNMSRLLPEERARLSQSTAGVGVSVGNSDYQFKLLYQQLFGPSSGGQSNRVIAGGVNITF